MGRPLGLEPVARTIALSAASVRSPSSVFTTRVLASLRWPVPAMTSTPRFFSEPCRPFQLVSTIFCLNDRTRSMSTPSKVALTPYSPAVCACSATSAACSSALVGMQPQCRQVPPTLSFSTRATFMPELGRAQRAGVAPRAAAQDDHVVAVSHCVVSAPVAVAFGILAAGLRAAAGCGG